MYVDMWGGGGGGGQGIRQKTRALTPTTRIIPTLMLPTAAIVTH